MGFFWKAYNHIKNLNENLNNKNLNDGETISAVSEN